jgi:hypothetical protein
VRGVHTVPLTLLDGVEKTALMLGQDLAWFCSCRHLRPLEGSVEPWSKEHPPQPIVCPQCNRQYVIFRADENMQYAQVVAFA